MTIARKAARKLSAEASKSGATVIGGQLIKEGDRYIINKIDVTALLESLLSQNVLLFVGAVANEAEEQTKTCLTCGDEYTGHECPRCANVRSRLRGQNNG